MSKLVADSCVIIKWLVDEPDTSEAMQLLVACVNGGTQLLAPDFACPEISNILWKKARRRLITVDQARQAFAKFRQLPLRFASSDELLNEALKIAFDFGQSPYDCLYVALSSRENCPLVTTDGPLLRNVGHAFPQIISLAG